ncbi:hypothetical protein Tco_0458523 [Tanacetum coccineum]
MVERDDDINVLGEINVKLESDTNKLIEKLTQEKDSQEDAFEKFNSTLDNVLEKLRQERYLKRIHQVAKEVMEMANDQAEELSDQEVADECLDDKQVEERRPSKRIRVVSSSRSFGSAVLGQMTYLVTSLTLDSARSYVIQGASFTQRTISSIPIGGNISPRCFSPSILLVVILVTVVIVVVVLVVVVIGVVIVVAIIGVVFVVGGVSFIIKLSFVIIVWGLEAITFPSMLLGNPPMKASRSLSVFGTMLGHMTASSWNLLTLGICKALSVRVPVANVTLFSSAHLLQENTNSVLSNQRIRPTAPSVPLKYKG